MNRKTSAAALAVLLGALAWAEAGVRDKVRVFITESKSWEISGGFGGEEGPGGISGGARPQTAEIIKTFNRRCPDFTVTLDRGRADYLVLLEHEGGKDLVRRDNKVAVFNRDADAIYSGSTRLLGNAVKEACNAIRRDLEQSGGAR